MNRSNFEVSVIIPVFEEERHLKQSLRVIEGVLKSARIKHNYVLIDDGSRDRTWETIKEAAREIPGITAVKFSRNFGKESALCAGLEVATGDACIVMDSDLQHPPALIPEMVRLWQEEGYEVVEGVKTSRGREDLITKIYAYLFYKTLKRFSGFDLSGASDFKLLDSKVVSSWRQLTERNTFFRGMTAWVGYKRIRIPFEVAARATGKTKWSKVKLFRLALTAITSFSSLPLYVVVFLGIVFLVGSIPLAIDTLESYFRGIAVSGFTTVILLLLIIGSILMISLGIIGAYIARIFEEVKHRPRYLVAVTITTGARRKGRNTGA